MLAFGGMENYVVGNIAFVGDAAAQTNALSKGGIRPGMIAGKWAAEAIVDNKIREYDLKWKKSKFNSPLILKAYEKLKSMGNRELLEHIEPFKEHRVMAYLKSLLFYGRYLELYEAYDISNKYGW